MHAVDVTQTHPTLHDLKQKMSSLRLQVAINLALFLYHTTEIEVNYNDARRECCRQFEGTCKTEKPAASYLILLTLPARYK